MKSIFTTLLLFLSLLLTAQNNNFEGIYIYDSENIKYTLTINTDKTFTFHFYRNVSKHIGEENYYGSGTWSSNKNLISLEGTQENTVKGKPDLSFNNTKARYISKSPRDKSDRIIKPALRFYESEIFWIKGLTLLKTE